MWYLCVMYFPNRQKLHDEFRRQIMSVFDQWDSDVEKLKDQEEKLSVSFNLFLNGYTACFSLPWRGYAVFEFLLRAPPFKICSSHLQMKTYTRVLSREVTNCHWGILQV